MVNDSLQISLSAKLVPVGYGIKKLQISAVIEDDKVVLLCLMNE